MSVLEGGLAVRSCVLVRSQDDLGVAVAAWNLQKGGDPSDMSDAWVAETVTPTIFRQASRMKAATVACRSGAA